MAPPWPAISRLPLPLSSLAPLVVSRHHLEACLHLLLACLRLPPAVCPLHLALDFPRLPLVSLLLLPLGCPHLPVAILQPLAVCPHHQWVFLQRVDSHPCLAVLLPLLVLCPRLAAFLPPLMPCLLTCPVALVPASRSHLQSRDPRDCPEACLALPVVPDLLLLCLLLLPPSLP